ncbi:MAG TPA: TonB-dependent receptor [Thermoanaerobaculia bacterium]|nr:TonB-dependent receptor [Thermoanaerobaculia bacterium]
MRRTTRSGRAVAPSLTAALLLAFSSAFAQEENRLESLSLEELMNVPVVTASNISERLSEAPATVIVITRQEIRERGYTDISEILDDLPGMDVVRPWGATYLKNYWRGYRNTIGDPFLIMVDGVVFNHLYFNTADVMVALPLSNVERVEIVYGPASSVYGASASMGVINVITRRRAIDRENGERVTLGASTDRGRLFDSGLLYGNDLVRVSLATRFDDGTLDDQAIERYEYTRGRYYSDRRLWGGFLDNPSLGGSFSSPRRHRALDLRAYAGERLEFALQYFRVNAGYGVEYAADRSQNHAVWSRPDLSAHVRLTRPFGERTRGATLLRYRTSDVSSDSYFVESLPGSPASPEQRAQMSFWRVSNHSISLLQDFDVSVRENFALRAGLRYEQKDLQKAYDTTYGPPLPVASIGSSYPFPRPPAGANEAQNRITTEDTGVYFQTWYRQSERHRYNFGLRADHNSKYGGATTLRMGYVGTYGPWGVKALFGQAFQEPNNRLLYGGWNGSGSDPRLRPERSKTVEVSASRTTRAVRTFLSLYRTDNENTFINTVSGAQNLGEREVIGFDLHVQGLLNARWQWKPWISYSRILRADEKKIDDLGNEAGMGRVGDLANHKMMFGVTAIADRHLTATLRGRFIGARTTVESNPVRRAGAYTTFDAAVRYDDLFGSGIGLSLKVTNLTNRIYFHPGVRDANAGTEPGRFDEHGVWRGSGGYFNSLLPQPGRVVTFALHWGE